MSNERRREGRALCPESSLLSADVEASSLRFNLRRGRATAAILGIEQNRANDYAESCVIASSVLKQGKFNKGNEGMKHSRKRKRTKDSDVETDVQRAIQLDQAT